MARSGGTTRRAFLARALGIGASSLVGSRIAPSLCALAAEPAQDVWQIGCFTRPWDQHEYRVALDAIAQAGFRYAGLMTQSQEQGKGGLVISISTTPEEAQQIGQEVRSRGLRIPCVYGGDFPVAESLEAGIAGLRRLIDSCAAAEARTLMVGGVGEAKLYDAYYRAIAEVCDYAAEKHVGVVLKPHGGLNATGPQCRKAIERVGHKNFTLWYDPGNIFYYSDGKLDPVEDLRTVAGLVTGMCVKDFSMTVDGEKVAKEVMLTPGTGKVDFPAVVAGLRKGGFTGGPVLIECLARGELPALLEEAKRARRFVETLLA